MQVQLVRHAPSLELAHIPHPEAIALPALLYRMHARQTTYWGWTVEDWSDLLLADSVRHACTQYAMGLIYLLLDFPSVHAFPINFRLYQFTTKVFGEREVEASVERVYRELRGWGWSEKGGLEEVHIGVAEILLAHRSPRLEGITVELLDRVLDQSLPHLTRIRVEKVAACW